MVSCHASHAPHVWAVHLVESVLVKQVRTEYPRSIERFSVAEDLSLAEFFHSTDVQFAARPA